MTQAQENIEQEQPAAIEVTDPVNANETVEIEVDNAEQETPAETKQEAKPFDPKTDKVDFTTPEQQEKFNYVYKQAKMSDQRNQMLTNFLQEQQKQLDDLKNRFSQTDSAEAERILMSKVKAARDSGDDAAEFVAINELVEFKADKKISEKVKPQQPVNQQQQYQHSKSQFDYVERMQQETDANGQLVRPYLTEGHPEFDSAVNYLESIAPKYMGDPLALEKSLFELEQVMKQKAPPTKTPPTQTRIPHPMGGGNLTNVKQKQTIKMTRAELDIARKLGVDPKRYAATRDADKGRS